jgi:hypothetical protein
VQIIDMTSLFSRSFPARLLGLALILSIAVAGCSKGIKKVTIRGTASYQGQMLNSGMIRFYDLEGVLLSSAVIQSDGTFIITDVIPGEVRVSFLDTPQGSGGPGASTQPKAPPVPLPEKYRAPETSGLQYTITPDTKELPIEIR